MKYFSFLFLQSHVTKDQQMHQCRHNLPIHGNEPKWRPSSTDGSLRSGTAAKTFCLTGFLKIRKWRGLRKRHRQGLCITNAFLGPRCSQYLACGGGRRRGRGPYNSHPASRVAASQ